MKTYHPAEKTIVSRLCHHQAEDDVFRSATSLLSKDDDTVLKIQPSPALFYANGTFEWSNFPLLLRGHISFDEDDEKTLNLCIQPFHGGTSTIDQDNLDEDEETESLSMESSVRSDDSSLIDETNELIYHEEESLETMMIRIEPTVSTYQSFGWSDFPLVQRDYVPNLSSSPESFTTIGSAVFPKTKAKDEAKGHDKHACESSSSLASETSSSPSIVRWKSGGIEPVLLQTTDGKIPINGVMGITNTMPTQNTSQARAA